MICQWFVWDISTPSVPTQGKLGFPLSILYCSFSKKCLNVSSSQDTVAPPSSKFIFTQSFLQCTMLKTFSLVKVHIFNSLYWLLFNFLIQSLSFERIISGRIGEDPKGPVLNLMPFITQVCLPSAKSFLFFLILYLPHSLTNTFTYIYTFFLLFLSFNFFLSFLLSLSHLLHISLSNFQVAIGVRECLNIYGNDWPTVDGTGGIESEYKWVEGELKLLERERVGKKEREGKKK